METWAILLGFTLVVVAPLSLLYFAKPYYAWVTAGTGLLLVWLAEGSPSTTLFTCASLLFLTTVIVFGVPSLRRRWVTSGLMLLVAKRLPKLGKTERIALEAGTVGWDRELFSGAPDWFALLDAYPETLSNRERAFLDGPVEQVCHLIDDWKITQEGDLPEEIWKFLQEEGFFGLIIPEKYGGLGFSAQAHSAVVTKLASRSVAAAVTVMVPNSLGPAELLLHYGTEAQRSHYLPRLARGTEIPCFALTGPEAGSDAAATQSEGVVCYGNWKGEEVLGMRLHWRKRYITLAPVATLIGLAFQLRDPDGFLGGVEDVGISCALIPVDLPGVEIGTRHDPLGVPFQNGPTSGRDVFVPLDAIIGGSDGAGQGWRMLMESLSAGRAISLPSVATAGAKLSARVVSAYAMVREQFDTPIGRFEGVEEPLARIAGLTYLTDAARQLTVSAVDAGEKPAVLSAIAKAYCTEAMRTVVNDAMDIRAGAAIMGGPSNILGRAYMTIPIGITVEGANILTRSMIVYGQGAIRCHPFALEEMEAVATRDLERFDRAFFGHLGFTATTAVRALLLGLSGGRTRLSVPSSAMRRGFQKLSRASAAFALVSDAAMASLGGNLKRKEKITGRLSDALAWLYLGSAALKRFRDSGEPEGDRALAQWAVEHALQQIETALAGVLRNLPSRPLAWVLAPFVFPLGRRARGPDDELGSAVAAALLENAGVRDRLTAGIFNPPAGEAGLGRLEAALAKAKDALAVEAKLRRAVRSGALDRAPGNDLARRACAIGLISEAELDQLHSAEQARDEAIQVDAFDAKKFPDMTVAATDDV